MEVNAGVLLIGWFAFLIVVGFLMMKPRRPR